jgi:hypothetical protein
MFCVLKTPTALLKATKAIRDYMRKIGRKGGLKGGAKLTSEQARKMVQIREQKRKEAETAA